MTDVCFWNIAIATQRQIIDGQNGDLGPLRAVPPVEETIAIRAVRCRPPATASPAPPTGTATGVTARRRCSSTPPA